MMQVQLELNSWHAGETPGPAPTPASAPGRHSSSPSHRDNHVDDHVLNKKPSNRTQRLFNELQRVIKFSGASSPLQQFDHGRQRKLLDFGCSTQFSLSRKMPPKKSGRAILREEGLEKTDNDLAVTSWPQVQMINQKNYYTEYLKKDEQYLAYRTLQEEHDKRMRKEAWDRARNGQHFSTDNGAGAGAGAGTDTPMDIDQDESFSGSTDNPNEPHGAKIIVIHPGSQNLRVGLASDALPKTTPMCIARKWPQSESEEGNGEPSPKRLKTEQGGLGRDKQHLSKQGIFGDDFKSTYAQMASDLKVRLRAQKLKVLPAQRDLIQKFNISQDPQIISEHNDPHRIDWTEIPLQNAPAKYTGMAALRIPDFSKPRYKLKWPMRNGCFNERDYRDRHELLDDFFAIIEDSLKKELGLQKSSWREYSCVFVIPDLYERNYVTLVLDGLMREFSFKRVCFIQESLAASFGNGQTMGCIVDIGAQKTSICCVEDGLCIEDSRMNLKYGGSDITELFIKMMLADQFPYANINLKRRYDWLLAEELKERFVSLKGEDVTQQMYDFHLRADGQNTRKYLFKTFDEQMLAPLAFWYPGVMDHAYKLEKRHTVVDRSYDLYDGSPNDPYSIAQGAAQAWTSQYLPSIIAIEPEVAPIVQVPATPNKPKPFNLLSRLPQDDNELTPRSSAANSPAPEGIDTPKRAESPGAGDGANTSNGGPVIRPVDRLTELHRLAEERSRILPLMPLDHAIYSSILQSSRASESRMKEFFSTITIVGGGSKIPGFTKFLEEKLREMVPGLVSEVEGKTVGVPGVVEPGVCGWKGAAVFGRLSGSGNDSWVWSREYDLLGSKLLAQKCMWNW